MTKRILRLNELIKKELGQIILREIEFPSNVLATITRVETASNLSVARVFLSVFPESFFVQAAKILNSQIYFLQQELNEKLRMRPVPRLIFSQEKETIKAGRIEELLEQVKEKPMLKKPRKSGKMNQ
ncbi:MAG: 30S ribosome-binding factor RbfA [bacterium]|nr:30S ribosome-binding factor RbfA [bacterium]